MWICQTTAHISHLHQFSIKYMSMGEKKLYYVFFLSFTHQHNFFELGLYIRAQGLIKPKGQHHLHRGDAALISQFGDIPQTLVLSSYIVNLLYITKRKRWQSTSLSSSLPFVRAWLHAENAKISLFEWSRFFTQDWERFGSRFKDNTWYNFTKLLLKHCNYVMF